MPITYEELTGMQKTAILIGALGKPFAQVIMKRMTNTEVDELTVEIARMENVDKEISKRIVREFESMLRANELVLEGGVDYARELLAETFGPARADEILKRVAKDIEDTGLNRLKKADPEQLRTLLRGEHPQTIALILAHLSSKQTSVVIAGFDPTLAAEVLYRMARMEKVSPQMLDLIESSLGAQAALQLNTNMSVAGGPEAVAEVLNLTAGSLEKTLLEHLSKRSPDLADQIKNLMFVFEDIMLLDEKSIQKVISECDIKDIALALKTASPDLAAKIKSTMSKRQAESLDEEIEYLGPVRVRDVETAQSKIVGVIRRLEEAGEIIVSGGSGEDAIID